MLKAGGVAIDDGDDFSTAQEKALGAMVKERYGTDFFMMDKYPSSVRPFYTMPDADDPVRRARTVDRAPLRTVDRAPLPATRNAPPPPAPRAEAVQQLRLLPARRRDCLGRAARARAGAARDHGARGGGGLGGGREPRRGSGAGLAVAACPRRHLASGSARCGGSPPRHPRLGSSPPPPQAEAKGIPVASIQAYVDSFKYGAMPHGGGGVGLERVVMLFLGLGNIRKASMFPRDPKRLFP